MKPGEQEQGKHGRTEEHTHPSVGDRCIDHSVAWSLKAVATSVAWCMLFLSIAFAIRIVLTIPEIGGN